MHTGSRSHIKYSLALLDLTAVNVIYGAILSALDTVQHSLPYTILLFAINFSWILSAYGTTLYIGKQNSYASFLKKSLQTFFLFITLLLFFIFFYHYSYSRLFVLLSLGIFFVYIAISRTALLGVIYCRNQLTVQKNVVVLGNNEVSQKLLHHFKTYRNGVNILGCFNGENTHKLNGTALLGNYEGIIHYSVSNNVHEIYSTISPEKNNMIYGIAEEAEKNYIRFKYVPDFSFFVNRRVHIELEKDIPILSMRPDPLEDESNRFKKRIFDIAFSGMVLLILLWWLIPIIALLIKLESRGPVFFKQLRSGKSNKPFYCYKFRSLRVNNDAEARQVTKNDSRFTRIGKFLRKTNLDELPQFFNVLQNTMSVIGPRPHMLKHTSEWAKLCTHYMARHYLKPGITGWAQVNGFRGEIENTNLLVKRIEHDIWYMENWSMWLDMRIVLLSVFKTIGGDKNAV
jgi:putative colanic acid biosynthesis UDP-glucose lipid carrier transferase